MFFGDEFLKNQKRGYEIPFFNSLDSSRNGVFVIHTIEDSIAFVLFTYVRQGIVEYYVKQFIPVFINEIT